MTPRLVIFDCDGVLVDTESTTDVVISDNLTRHGLRIAPGEVHSLFAGGTMRSVMEEARRRGTILPDEWLDEIYASVFAALRHGVPIIEGVFDLINALDRAGVARAIASNGPLAKMEISLTPSGLWNLFEGRIYSGHDHGPKPQPDMLLQIIADADVRADETVMIDDMPAGFLAARAAGIRCLGYVAVGDPGRTMGTGAKPITDLAEVINILNLP